MQLDVFFTPEELAGADIAGHTAVVIDVLRATSTITEATANGARAIYPVDTMEEAVRLGQNLGREGLLLCGERKGVKIEGFDLGNSPLEFTREAVEDRVLVMATTNGTPALVAAAAARRTLPASFLNLSAVAAEIAEDDAVAVICSGRESRFALEDAVCAGMLARRLMEMTGHDDDEPNDGAAAAIALANRWAEELVGVLRRSAAGRHLIEIGHEDDVVHCASVDLFDVVPRLEDRRITA